MGLNHCRLTESGKRARDELLELLYLSNSYTDTQLTEETGIDRTQTIPKILGKKTGGIQLRKLEQFFERLLYRLNADLDASSDRGCQVADYLQRHRLKAPFELHASGDGKFYLPKKLYEISENNKPENQKCKLQRASIKNIKSNSSSVNNVVDIFWDLDYKNQERAFKDTLDEQRQCAAFSIAAPCSTTQRWLLNRLIRLVPNQENAVVVSIDMQTHSMRHEFNHFWEDLSAPFGVTASQEDVLKALCCKEVSRPVILTIYNFHHYENPQFQLLNKFLVPLMDKVTESKREERSRIVLFFVDRCWPNSTAVNLTNLDPLAEIPQNDVRNWLKSDLVVRWGKPRLGDDFAEEILEEFSRDEHDWNWKDPYLILDKVCFKLGVTNAIVELDETWKWAS